MKAKHILVPVDFSDNSPKAIQEAAGLAAVQNGKLTLMHVHQVQMIAIMDFTYVEPPEQLAEVCAQAEKKLAAEANKLKEEYPSLEVNTEVQTGHPVEEIIKASENVDLVVMPTHGRSGVQHFLMGSVAERVVQGAKCSVLVVK